MIKAFARRIVVAFPPVRRLQGERTRLRQQVRVARADAAHLRRKAARLEAKLAVAKAGRAAARSVKVLDPQLAALDKINFGCGWDKRAGFLNIDVESHVAPDLLVVDGDYSMIPRRHYREILANDVLEHISHKTTLSVLLDWADFLRDGGRLHVQTSSILGVADQLKNSEKFEQEIGWTYCLFGNQAHAGDFHHVGFTETTLKTFLRAAGFQIDSFDLKDAWLFHVDCHKVYDWTSVLMATDDVEDDEFIRAIYLEAFGREPDDNGYSYLRGKLASGKMNRRDALKHLMQSRERLYYTASRTSAA